MEESGSAVQNKSFSFTGKGGEFFAIWIVNVALTILTLGIYSAWAKVRTHQYFYGNTLLDGASFRYTANPVQILKGRLIAFALFVGYYIASTISPVVAASALVILMILVPVLIVLSMSFRLRNSVYRNVSFGFNKDFVAAYKVFAIPVVIVGAYIFIAGQLEGMQASEEGLSSTFTILIGLLLPAIIFMFPWWEKMITEFKVIHAKYGTSDFVFSATVKNFYGMYIKMYGLLILIFAVLGVLIAVFMNNPDAVQGMPLIVPFFGIVVFIVYMWIFAYMQAKRTNLIYNNLNIAGHKVQSKLSVNYLLYLYVTNTLAMMATLGLLMPWAKIRTARYKASVTSLNVAGDLGQFVSAQAENQSALGEEVGDMFDMDLGF